MAVALQNVEATEVVVELNADKYRGIRSPVVTGELLPAAASWRSLFMLSHSTAKEDVSELALELEDTIKILDAYYSSMEEDTKLRNKLLVLLSEEVETQEKRLLVHQSRMQVSFLFVKGKHF